MNTTKRKFNALLQGMGSSTSLQKDSNGNSNTTTPRTSTSMARPDTSVGAGTELEAKKRRIIPSKSAPSVTLVPALGHKKSYSTATTAPAEEAPKYAPWDRVAFLQRLKSFSNLTEWTPKPAKVNEVEWAKRGWVCQKQERVRCCLCNTEIVVKLNRKEVEGKEEPVYIASNIEDALVEKYVELIVSSHDPDCLWRRRGCDDSIFKLPLSNTTITLQDLRNRYDELCLRKDTLPYTFNLRLPTTFDLNLVLSYLPQNFFAYPTELAAPDTPTSVDNKVAFQMALFGWQGHKHDRLGSQMGSVSCHVCFRVLGLWIFKSKSVNEAGEEVEGAPASCLNVVTEHRDYCPWQNATSQNGNNSAKLSTSGMAGWEIVLLTLRNDYHLRHPESRKTAEKQRMTSFEETGEYGAGDESEDDETRSIREEDEKNRWSRLKRVKSLFDTKGRKAKRSSVIEPKSK